MTVVTRVRFPSLEWFQALQQLVNDDQATFRKLGVIDANVVVEVTADEALPQGKAFLLAFGAYTCDRVTEVTEPGGPAADFTLEAPYGTWEEMIKNIRANQGADLQHTLNYLHFGRIALKAADQLRADLFFRVNSSLQAFFDKSAAIETEFAR